MANDDSGDFLSPKEISDLVLLTVLRHDDVACKSSTDGCRHEECVEALLVELTTREAKAGIDSR